MAEIWEICSCEIANVATSASGMEHGWELRESTTRAQGPSAALQLQASSAALQGQTSILSLLPELIEPERLSYTNITHKRPM